MVRGGGKIFAGKLEIAVGPGFTIRMRFRARAKILDDTGIFFMPLDSGGAQRRVGGEFPSGEPFGPQRSARRREKRLRR